jgi:hypothetical protein
MSDFTFINHGSVTTLKPVSDAAKEWVSENIAADATYWAGAVVIEPRYVADIIDGIHADGLTVE